MFRTWKKTAKEVLFVVGAGLVLGQLACDGPCLQLANRICDCEPDLASQQSCRNQVSLETKAINPTITPGEAKLCGKYLTTCTCNSLRANRANCGFQRPVP